MDLRILPIFLILFLLIPGCLQAAYDETEQFSEYSFPEAEFTMHTPQSWQVEKIIDHSHVVFTPPDNRASIAVEILESNRPEGQELIDIGLRFDRPNTTQIGYSEPIHISGADGFEWQFLVHEPDRQYVEGVIGVARECPGRTYRTLTYYIRYEYPAGDAPREEMVREMLNSIELSCPSVNYYPDSGFSMDNPQSWQVEKWIEKSQVRCTHPENRASIDVRITQSTLPEGMEQPGGFGMSYEKPNSTIIESYEKIQISGVPGTRWTFLVNESDRQYIEGFIGVARKCPDRKYDGITYFISYHYTTGDPQLEETVKEMLDSIELSCSSG
jgi:hypothetical protein